MPHPGHLIYDHLQDSAGSHDMHVDGSSTPVIFRYKCPVGFRAFLYRTIIQIQDAGMTHITYGGLAALTNGVSVCILDSSDVSIADLMGDETIKDNATWRSLCYDADIVTKGALDNLTIRWTFSKDTGGAIMIEPNQSFAIVVRDDLTGLTLHHALVRGFVREIGLGKGK